MRCRDCDSNCDSRSLSSEPCLPTDFMGTPRMPSPFPGMDPYLENRSIFPDFHDGFIFAFVKQSSPGCLNLITPPLSGEVAEWANSLLTSAGLRGYAAGSRFRQRSLVREMRLIFCFCETDDLSLGSGSSSLVGQFGGILIHSL